MSESAPPSAEQALAPPEVIDATAAEDAVVGEASVDEVAQPGAVSSEPPAKGTQPAGNQKVSNDPTLEEVPQSEALAETLIDLEQPQAEETVDEAISKEEVTQPVDSKAAPDASILDLKQEAGQDMPAASEGQPIAEDEQDASASQAAAPEVEQDAPAAQDSARKPEVQAVTDEVEAPQETAPPDESIEVLPVSEIVEEDSASAPEAATQDTEIEAATAAVPEELDPLVTEEQPDTEVAPEETVIKAAPVDQQVDEPSINFEAKSVSAEQLEETTEPVADMTTESQAPTNVGAQTAPAEEAQPVDAIPAAEAPAPSEAVEQVKVTAASTDADTIQNAMEVDDVASAAEPAPQIEPEAAAVAFEETVPSITAAPSAEAAVSQETDEAESDEIARALGTQQPTVPAPDTAASNASEPIKPATPATPSSSSASSPRTSSSSSPRISLILNINKELIRLCVDMQSRNQISDPLYREVALRLQGNLGYLAGMADKNKTGGSETLPKLEPFPALEGSVLPSLYEKLGTLFQKRKRSTDASEEVARKRTPGPDLLSAPPLPTPHPSPPNPNPQAQALLQAFGPNALTNLHSLQAYMKGQSTSPWVTFMETNVPNFSSLPLQMQLQQMTSIQTAASRARMGQ